MEERFYGFGQLTRPDIGLVADGVLNLAEIYSSDQKTALRNVFLEPEILDIIYNLSRSITREDLRAASGLTSPLLQTLDLQSETFANINDSLDEYISASTPIGADPDNRSLSGTDVRLNHTILYSGALHCEGAQYETRSLDQNSLTGSGVRTLTTISTSRASLFNSEKDENTGAFEKAYLSDSIRVRRRSHVNRIEVNPLTFIPKPEVLENPTHKILCWINDTTGDPQDSKKMQLLAVKNSPVRLPCRFSKGKITFTFKSVGVNFYGFKIQPLQTKGNGDDVQFLSVPSQSMAADQKSFTLDLDITKTGYANTFDLYLYLYMNVEEVASIVFEGIGITDFQDKQDIGLIGFNKLESLDLSGTRLRYLPIWLKTLGGTIKSLDFSGSADTYVEGPFRYFDYRLRGASPSTSIPLYTGISYLTVPKLGAIINEGGNGWNDELFRKYIHSQVLSGESIDDVEERSFTGPNKDFRRFSALQSLKLGWKFLGRNPRLDDVFPDLREIEWYGAIGETGTRFPIQGTPIKIAYPGEGKSVRYISYLSGAVGTIKDIGTSSDPQDVSTSAGAPTYIGAYEFSTFDISGRDNGAVNDFYQEISGFIANPAEVGSWNGWLEKTGTIRINYTKCKIDLQTLEWKSLSILQIDHSNGVVLEVSNNKSSGPIKARLLGGLDPYSGNCSGHLPSLGLVQNTNNLKSYGFGGYNPNLNTFSYTITGKTFNYFLPENFAPIRSKGEEHKLESFGFQDGNNGALPEGRFRYDDFDNLPNLKTIRLHRSPNIKGIFPNIPEVIEPDKNSKEISVTLYEDCGIYDITSLGINEGRGVARDIKELIAWGLNSSNGGCIAPDFKGRTDSKITDLKLTGLRTYYPSSWQPNSSLSEKLILDDDLPSVVGSLTYNKFDPTTESSNKFSLEDIIHYLQGDGSKNLKQYVLVNDRVSLGSKTSAIATVLSVENDRIYIRVDSGSELTDGSTNTYNFYRQTQDVGGWFKKGFKDITTLHMNNSRLSGELDITAGFSKITGDDGFRMYDNGLTSITKNTFVSIFKGSNRNITLKFSKNNFSAVTLKNIVQRLLEVQEATNFTAVKVYLDNCKLSNGSYSTYSRSEIFKTESQDLPDETIPLTSFVDVAVFKEVITTDPETGESNPPQLIEISTKQIQVSGKDVFGDGKYYTSQVNKKIKAVEDPLADRWRKSKWDIVLDFPKSDVPITSPQTLSTSYLPSGGLTQAQFYALNNIDPSLVR